MRLIVEPATDALEEPEDYCDTLPTPTNTVRDRAHLDELLMAGINSPGHVMTEQDRINIDKAVEDRLKQRSGRQEQQHEKPGSAAEPDAQNCG